MTVREKEIFLERTKMSLNHEREYDGEEKILVNHERENGLRNTKRNLLSKRADGIQ